MDGTPFAYQPGVTGATGRREIDMTCINKTRAIRSLGLVLAAGSMAASLASSAVHFDSLHHWYDVKGYQVWTFDPDKSGDEQRAKDACQKFANEHHKTCTGPHKGSALPAY